MSERRPYSGESGTETQRPTSELEIYGEASRPTVDDEFLKNQNFGLGNYSEQERWQQVTAFLDGMYGEASFKRLLLRRTIYQTKRRLALNGAQFTGRNNQLKDIDGWHDLSDSKRSSKNKSDWITQRGDHIWKLVPDDQKDEYLQQTAKNALEFKPPHYRMMQARHELSRGNQGLLLNNLFGRIQEKVFRGEGEVADLFGGSE